MYFRNLIHSIHKHTGSFKSAKDCECFIACSFHYEKKCMLSQDNLLSSSQTTFLERHYQVLRVKTIACII